MSEESQEYRLGEVSASVRALKETLETHIEVNEKTHTKLFDQLTLLHAEVSLARNFLLFAKLLGLTVIAVLTFKFGDISTIWSKWKGY